MEPRPGGERMDSKAQVLGVVLKKRRATLTRPGGKEVRGRVWKQKSL